MDGNRVGGVPDVLMLAVIGCAVALGALVWVWGGLAGAIFGAGWPRVPAADVLGVLARLPARLSDPGRAWPVSVRGQLPGAGGFYLTLALLLGAATTIGGLAGRAAGRPALRRRSGAARWASAAELRSLRAGPLAMPSRRPAAGDGARLTLGWRRGRLLRAERRHALVAFGPPQSGKSAGLAIPALLEWAGPAVATSIKTDLLSATLSRRRELGAVFVFDPFGLAGVRSHTWSPLHGADTWDGALEAAWRLAASGEIDSRGVEGGDFWAVAAEQRLAPLLFTAARTGATMDEVLRWTYGQGSRELHETLTRLAERAQTEHERAGAHAAYDAVRAFEAQADRTRTSIEATAQALLRGYRFERVASSARGCEITPDAVLGEPATLYLIGDAKAAKLLRPIFLALLCAIVDRAYERATAAGGRLPLPLLLCLDEAGNVAPLPNLAEIASTAPSHNIQLVSIFHDLAQARSRYGRQAQTVVNSHRARMLLPGVADLETLRYFAGLLGEEEAPDLTRTTGAGGSSRSTARRRRPLLAPEALRRLPDGHALLLYGRVAPAQVRLRMWFSDRRLRRLARRG